LWRGDFTPRVFYQSPESRVIAVIARDRESKRFHAARPYNRRHRAGSEKQNRGGIVASTLPTDSSSRIKKALTGPF
jgi:hypothetical protein